MDRIFDKPRIVFVGFLVLILFAAFGAELSGAADIAAGPGTRMAAEDRTLTGPGPDGRSDIQLLSRALVTTGAVAGIALIIAIVSLVRLKNSRATLDHERKRLKKSREHYRLIVENADDGILIVQQLVFTYANRQVYEIMGLVKDGTASRNLVDYVYPEDLDIVLEHYEKSVITGQTDTNFEVRLVKKDKSLLWVRIRFVPVIWNNEPANLAFMRDITPQKLMEQDLQQAQRLEAIGALSGGIAHDFNNILTTIIGNAEIALMDVDRDDNGYHEFEQIRESGYRARDLVSQILTINREYTRDIQPLYLSPVIKEALKLLRSTLPANVNIVSNIAPRIGLVKADPTQVYQVFMNLCTNAKRAMEGCESPCLEVELKNLTVDASDGLTSGEVPAGTYVWLRVRDNGTGIDPDVAKALFSADPLSKKREAGSGIGLATSFGIVKQFKGHITFESDPGDGASFSVYLPVYEPEDNEKREADAGEATCGTGKILFVDDEVEITAIAQRMFTSLGYAVKTATSGKEALQFFAMDPDFFDLVITDLSMPEMTGERLVKEICRIRSDIPVILCTGHSDTFDAQKAKAIGAVQYISKPYNLNALSNLASKYIRESRAA